MPLLHVLLDDFCEVFYTAVFQQNRHTTRTAREDHVQQLERCFNNFLHVHVKTCDKEEFVKDRCT